VALFSSVARGISSGRSRYVHNPLSFRPFAALLTLCCERAFGAVFCCKLAARPRMQLTKSCFALRAVLTANESFARCSSVNTRASQPRTLQLWCLYPQLPNASRGPPARPSAKMAKKLIRAASFQNARNRHEHDGNVASERPVAQVLNIESDPFCISCFITPFDLPKSR
jgi:hypothetical protein